MFQDRFMSLKKIDAKEQFAVWITSAGEFNTLLVPVLKAERMAWKTVPGK
jgi:hypothetical protein